MSGNVIATGRTYVAQFLAGQPTAKRRPTYWSDEFTGSRAECREYIEVQCREYGYHPDDCRIIRREWRDREVQP